MHLDIYQSKSILHTEKGDEEFAEGKQGEEAKKNYETIKDALEDGYLEEMMNNIHSLDFTNLDGETKDLILPLH